MQLIFNGDDFGLTQGINHGIIQAFKKGILSSTSLVATGEAFEDAVSLAKENPGLDVGIHLVLCDEAPLIRSGRLAHGSTFPSRNRVLAAILCGRTPYEDVEAEWRAQVQTGIDAGLSISHLDGHQFIHLFPGLFPVCLRVAAFYRIPFVRTSLLDLIHWGTGTRRLVQWALLNTWISLYVAPRIPRGMPKIPSMGFLEAGGRLEGTTILRAVDRVNEKGTCETVEVMVHPATGDPHTASKYRDWHYHWEADLHLLLDASLKRGLDARGIRVTSYRQLLGDAP